MKDEIKRLGILKFKRGDVPPVDSNDYSILGKLYDLDCNHCYGLGFEVINKERTDCRCVTMYVIKTAQILTPQRDPVEVPTNLIV